MNKPSNDPDDQDATFEALCRTPFHEIRRIKDSVLLDSYGTIFLHDHGWTRAKFKIEWDKNETNH